jgi:two-component system, NtrC family, sensor histidine kinase KinB
VNLIPNRNIYLFLIAAFGLAGILLLAVWSPEEILRPALIGIALLLSALLAILIRKIAQSQEDVAFLKEAEHANEIRERLLEEANQAIFSQLDLQSTLAQVCNHAQFLGEAERSAIHMLDPEQTLVRIPYALGFSEEFLRINRTYSTGLAGRNSAAEPDSPLSIQDILEIPDPPPFIAGLLADGVRSFVEIPLTVNNELLGYLSIYYDRPGEIKPVKLETLEIFSVQVSLAIKNAVEHARMETAYLRRTNQLEILENIGRELAEASHSDHLFDLILDQALEFTNSPWGSISLYDPAQRTMKVKAARGFASDEERKPLEPGPLQVVITTGQALIIPGREGRESGIFLAAGARSHLSVPLIHNRLIVGVLSLESPEEDAFTENDRFFIGQLATQAAVAVINSDLYEEAQRRLEAQSALYQASRKLVGNLELQSIARNVVHSFHDSIESRGSGVYLWDENAQAYRLVAVSGEDADVVNHLPDEISGVAWEESSPALLGTGLLRLPGGPASHVSSLSPFPGCQTLALPLTRGDHQLGLIIAHIPEERTLSEAELQLPRAIAAQAAIAMQNARLFHDVREGRDRLEAVLDSVDEGVLMIDAGETIILANTPIQMMTGVSLEKILGTNLNNLQPEVLTLIGIDAPENGSIKQALRQPEHLYSTKATLTGSGEKSDRVFERFASPVWGQGREVIGWVFVLRDVTEEHQLNQARELLTETLVHDLRSPMSAIGSALSILKEVIPPSAEDPAIEQSLDIATRSANRVMGLVESLLDISRMETGSIELDLTPLNIVDLTDELLADYTPLANELGILLKREIPPELPHPTADRDKITRVLINLIDNALKFTPEGGQIVLAAEAGENLITIFVTDSGPGIPEEYRQKIFDRFAQIPGVRGRRRGSGLGLTFCHLAIEAHGGEIRVDEAAGGGSIFSFTLPVRE